MDIHHSRKEYRLHKLDEGDLAPDPFTQFDLWLKEAIEAGEIEPNAMALATASTQSKPSCRMVLLKHHGNEGFDFFTNLKSRKATELESNPLAAATFYWKILERQVTIEGTVEKLSSDAATAYFSSRPRGSQIAAWASHQGEVIASRADLEKAFKAVENRYQGQDVPLPPFWGGFRLKPTAIEFWQGREDRLHDRFCYRLDGKKWMVERLSP